MSASSMQGRGFWTWQIDHAAAESTNNRLAVGSGAVYVIGALTMLFSLIASAPAWLTMTGGAMVLLGVAVSVGVVGKVLLQRYQFGGL